MPAYLISRLKVHDPVRFEEYRRVSIPLAVSHGARYLARSDAVVCLEGGYDGRRLVIIEFPSMAALRAFYDSPEYRRARGLREGACDIDLWAIDGMPPA
jgi:uncharacterized protein (DUF1330 family)